MNPIATALLWATYLVSLFFGVFWLLVFMEPRPEIKKKSKRFPCVSIVIPAWNEEDSVEHTLRNVLNLEWPKDKIEFIVVNDGSTDNTLGIVRKVIRQFPERRIVLVNQKNSGKGAAMNNALGRAKGELFVCMDADSFVDNDALQKLVPYFEEDDVAAVLPALKVKSPKNILQKMQWYEYIVNLFYKELMGRLNCVHVAPGPFSVYRKSILEKVGGFDENNLTEDLEIALRLQSSNYKIIQVLDTNAESVAPSTLKELYLQRNRWYKGSILNVFKYKNMMFNRAYGDFGFIQMPTIVASGIIALVIISSIAYYSIKPQIQFVKNLGFVNYDVLTLVKTFTLNLHILDIDFTTLFVGLVMFGISIYVFKKSHSSAKENSLSFGLAPLIFYLAVYFIILSIMWIGISADLILRRKQKW